MKHDGQHWVYKDWFIYPEGMKDKFNVTFFHKDWKDNQGKQGVANSFKEAIAKIAEMENE